MAIQLPALPWAENALEPHISAETISYHYGKHHNAYAAKLNAAIEGTDNDSKSLEEIVMSAEGGLFNNAAQVWNHTFYWNCLAPNAGGPATGAIAEKINAKWGSFDKFQEEFTKSAATNFGSGWTWLVKNSTGELEIVNTDDADCPITDDQTPILTIDVWEHAYYVDYRNVRPNYVNAIFDVVNWKAVEERLVNAQG